MFIRNCPTCKKEIIHNMKGNRDSAIRNNINCKSCASKKIDRKGNKNPFFGKKHKKETIEIISNKIKLAVTKGIYQTEEYKEKMSKISKERDFGGSVYKNWRKWGYSEDEIILKTKIWNSKKSNAFKGKNNPMYGKPSPNGSGNGWKGWYKGWFFRSLRELSYMIDVIEKNNYEWTPGEKFCRLEYIDYSGKQRTYRPDFLINNKTIIEIKPKRLWKTSNVISKVKAGIKFAKEKGLKYKLVDIKITNYDIIIQKVNLNEIKFLGNYLERFEKHGKTKSLDKA